MKEDKTLYTKTFNKLFDRLGLKYSFEEYSRIKGKRRLIFMMNDVNNKYTDIKLASSDVGSGTEIIIDLKSDKDYKDIEYGIMKFMLSHGLNRIIGFDKNDGEYRTLFKFPVFENISQASIILDMMP